MTRKLTYDCSVELPKSWKPLLPVIFLAGTLQGSFLPLGAALVHSSCKLKGKGFSDLPTRSRNLATPFREPLRCHSGLHLQSWLTVRRWRQEDQDFKACSATQQVRSQPRLHKTENSKTKESVRVLPHWPLPPRAHLTRCMKAWVPFLAVDKPRAVPVKEKKQLTRILASPSLGCNEEL